MILLALTSLASAQDACSDFTLTDVLAVEAPAVLVLGERHGTGLDLGRATRIAKRLADDQPVTVALEAVHESKQEVLDDFRDGELSVDGLREALEWDDSWGYAWGPYRPLVAGAALGFDVLAVGPTLQAPPKNKRFPVPPGYAALLEEDMGEHPVAKGIEERFVRSMAWRDNRIAHLAQQNWDRRGYLIVVTGRGHVEGGLGVPWQLDRMMQGVPVHAFVLAHGNEPRCTPGDRYWRQSFVERLLQ